MSDARGETEANRFRHDGQNVPVAAIRYGPPRLGETNDLRPSVNDVERFVGDVISNHVQAFGFPAQRVKPGAIDEWPKWD